MTIEPLWIFEKRDLIWLTAGAVELRYPGERADREDVRRAVRMVRRIRKMIRGNMGLE